MSKILQVGWLPALGVVLLLSLSGRIASAQANSEGIPYLRLSEPKRILEQAQTWEGDQQPHTLSVVELNRGGFRYWGYYGLNEGRGTGLAFSQDLVHWTKYEKNPLWKNARWTSVLSGADPRHPGRLHYAITRNYDTPQSHIVLASSDDGIHLKELKVLVKPKPAPRNRNQNPNLFRDPVSKQFVLTYYSGNDDNHFDVVARSATRIGDLAAAPERILLHETTILAAPTMLHLKPGPGSAQGGYYLATEICPQVGPKPTDVEWQVKVFHSERLEGPYRPVSNNPVQTADRACLFQHSFQGRYFGFQSHRLQTNPIDVWEMEVIEAPLP